MKQQRKLPGILIYLLILFFSVISFVYALQLNANVTEGYQTVYTGGTSTNGDGVEVSKTLKETGLENYFDITLTVKTTTKIEQIIEAQDIAVVIVMDVSQSMNSQIDSTSGNTRLKEAKDAAQLFLTKFQESASETGSAVVRREVALVQFATNAETVFGLTECRTSKQLETLNGEISSISTKTLDERFTNMEGGLSVAKEILKSSDIQNQFIIFLTDGLPTTYNKKSVTPTKISATGWNPQGGATNVVPTTHTDGVFYNFNTGEFIYKDIGSGWAGTNYSDYGARMAEAQVKSLLNAGVTIYSIGVDIESQPTLYHLDTNNPRTFDTDKEEDNWAYYGNRYYAVTPGITRPLHNGTAADKELYTDSSIYAKWVEQYMSSGSGYYYNSKNSGDIEDAYEDILEGIEKITEESAKATWVAEDPMGVNGDVENIEFVAFIDDSNVLTNSLKNGEPNQSDTAIIGSNNKISWDLKDSEPIITEEPTENGKITKYVYSIKYRVRIENELKSFNLNDVYETNGTTKLTYVVRNTNGALTETREIEFKVPSVAAYLGELEFKKKNASFDDIASGVLEGAEFTLTHDPNCPCMVVKDTNHVHMSENQKYVETSDADGIVKFTKIPSGHKYILSETKAPDNYNGTTETYNINVAYGETTGGPADGIVENTIQKGKLKITKTVEGNKDYSGDFEFEVTLTYKTTTLTGKYDYKKFNGSNEEISSGEIDLTKGKFKLKDGEYIIIYGLPIGSKYTVKELTTNGYTVKHGINTEERTTGATATCSSSDCDINNGGTQTVNFYNIAGYILPATGSSGMLILIIIVCLLMIGPIIDIGYMFYKNRKEDKLTS